MSVVDMHGHLGTWGDFFIAEPSAEWLVATNTRIGIEPASEAWSREIWAQNLTNSQFYQVIVDQPLQSGTYGAFLGQPRLYGVTGRVRF